MVHTPESPISYAGRSGKALTCGLGWEGFVDGEREGPFLDDPGGSVAMSAQALDLSDRFPHSLHKLTSFFRARGVPHDEAADLASETVVRLLVHLRRHGQTSDDLGPLARTIGKNLLVERARRGRAPLQALEGEADIADDSPGPEDLAISAEKRTNLRRALVSLPPRQRRVIELSLAGKGPAEISKELGIKRNAADALLHRAKRALASKVRGDGLLGIAGLLTFKVKFAWREAANQISGMSVTAQATAAATTLAIAVLVGSPSGMAPGTTSAPVTSDSTSLQIDQDLAPRSPRASAPASYTVGDHVAGVRIEAAKREIGAEIAPTEDSGSFGVGIVHEREEDGDRGTLGPVLDRAADALCPSLDQCSEEHG